jgi:NAD-dependent dihydropyrimidine dehydrogenase PreA subunit
MIRTVDQTKCIGCGACQKICPLDVFRMDVKQPTASPCISACPIEVDIRGVNYLLAEGYVDKASQVLQECNPLASITGRICSNFCESECSRNKIDEALNFGAIEQFLGDYELQKPVNPVPRQHITPVAVIGSGPAGLSCAWFLAIQGFSVTLFEADDKPGGLLGKCFPESQLPSSILSTFIEKLRTLGVNISCNQKLDIDFTLESLIETGFGSVFLGLGAGKSKTVSKDKLNAILGCLPAELLNEAGLISASYETCQTPNPKVFAAGDTVSGPASVAGAIGGGKRAAQAIAWYLIGRDLEALPPRRKQVLSIAPEFSTLKKTSRYPRITINHPGQHVNTESYKGYDLLQTLAEADRCMTCGGKAVIAHLDDCMTCFSCELSCPSRAIFVHPFKEILPRSLRPI